jgi:peptide methionine sulfoxide reductase MsrA
LAEKVPPNRSHGPQLVGYKLYEITNHGTSYPTCIYMVNEKQTNKQKTKLIIIKKQKKKIKIKNKQTNKTENTDK